MFYDGAAFRSFDIRNDFSDSISVNTKFIKYMDMDEYLLNTWTNSHIKTNEIKLDKITDQINLIKLKTNDDPK